MALELVSKLPYDHPYRWDGTLFGGPKLWRPDELGVSLALWLDAEDTASITLNGSNVSQWADKSGNDYHASQAVASAQPAYSATGMNGKPTIDFDGSNDFLEAASAAVIAQGNDTPFSVMSVFNYASGAAIRHPINFSTTTSAEPFHLPVWIDADNTLSVQRRRNLIAGDRVIIGSTTSKAGSNVIFGQVFTGTGVEAFADGASILSGAMDTAAFDAGTPDTFTLGALKRNTIAGYTDMNMSEVVITNGALSDTDRQKLEGYLAWKWGLEANLPVDHPYKTTPPTV